MRSLRLQPDRQPQRRLPRVWYDRSKERRRPNVNRRVFNSVSIVSLLLCFATIGMWVRSYHAQDNLCYRTRSSRIVAVRSESGRLIVETIRQCFDPEYVVGLWHYSEPWDVASTWPWVQYYPPPSLVWNKWGFTFASGWRLTPVINHDPDVVGAVDFFDATGGAVPYVVVAIVFGGMPARWAGMRWRARTRRRLKGCAVCGYDLRAMP